jgi:hypothetical protein
MIINSRSCANVPSTILVLGFFIRNHRVYMMSHYADPSDLIRLNNFVKKFFVITHE